MADRDQWNNQTGKELTNNIAIAKMLFSLMHLKPVLGYPTQRAGNPSHIRDQHRQVCPIWIHNEQPTSTVTCQISFVG